MEQIIGILVLVGIVGFVIYKQKPEWVEVVKSYIFKIKYHVC